MNYNSLCYKCFSEKSSPDAPCPKCGHINQTPQLSQACLRAGTLLNHRYIVGVALGIGGFGITYRCFDTKIGGICAVKEYFPGHMGVRSVSGTGSGSKMVSVSQQDSEKYHYIMTRFVQEAELLRTLDHKNIIKVYDCFSENNTAYYVMEYCSGIDLRKYTNNFKNRLGYDDGMNILFQVMNGLEYVHSKGVLHRDIAPDNIYVTKSGNVKILDFGAARQEGDQLKRSLSIIIKAGYAPVEQYGKQKQGPYTDIYALGATFYHLFTGRIPEESTKRVLEDALIPFSQLRPDLPDKLKYCIERCMAVRISDRVKSVAEMKQILGIKPAVPAANSVKAGYKQQPAASVPKQNIRQTPPPAQANKNMPQGGVQSPQGGGYYGKRRANIFKRGAACLIDYVLFAILPVMICCVIGLGIDSFILWGITYLTVILLCIICELVLGKTPGKALLKMTVQSSSGGSVSAGNIIIRNLIKLIGIFVLLSGKKGELLQDRLTGSGVYSD